MDIAHFPVLVDETLHLLKPRTAHELMIDATMGEGGHSKLFLERYPDLRVVGLDADSSILAVARERLKAYSDRVEFHNTWFNLFFKDYPTDLDRPDTILFDLGISGYHYDRSGRGFSFRKDEPLDMRLSEDLELSARDIINEYPESELADIFYEFGEERYSRRIARAIVDYRSGSPIDSSSTLADLIYRAVPSEYRHGKIHPATRSFQGLRIAVNGELARLEAALSGALSTVKVGGRIGVISFHSLEDRIVKRFFREKNKTCTCPPEQPMCNCGGRRMVEIVTKKPISATDDERSANASSRSAKLRVVIKLEEEQ